MARFPLAVRGVAAALGPEEALRAFERLSFAGRWRDGGPGEVGSFLTMILGSSVRFLLRTYVSDLRRGRNKQRTRAYISGERDKSSERAVAIFFGGE